MHIPESLGIHALAERTVGPHFGIIEDLREAATEPDDPPLSVFTAKLANTSAFARAEIPRVASGAAMDSDDATGACIGEALERYCAGLPRPGSVRTARIAELPGRVVSPDSFALFSWSQYWRRGVSFPFSRWSAADRIGWVEAHSPTRGDSALVPAVFALHPCPSTGGEPLIAPSLSTGLACGRTWSEAVEAGLWEVIERDAVALAWLGMIQPHRMDPHAAMMSEATSSLLESIRRAGFRLSLLDLSSEFGVTVAGVLLEGHSPLGLIVSFGSAAHGDPDRALRKALVESIHCRMYVKSVLRRTPGWRAGRGFRHVTSFECHARLYSSHPEHRRALDRWWNPIRASDARRDGHAPTVEECVATLEARGHEVLTVDVTTPDVRELGLHVARVMVPGLQPLHGHHAWAHLGGGRLKRFPEIFGSHVKKPWRWNPHPHPCA